MLNQIKSNTRWVLKEIKEKQRENKVYELLEYEGARVEAKIVKLMHSIEKGLCVKNMRYGFGYQKIKALYDLIIKNANKYDLSVVISMASDALGEYCDVHEKAGYSAQEFKEIQQMYAEIRKIAGDTEGKIGGTQIVYKSECEFNAEEISRLFYSRHSVRDFTGEPVPFDLVEKAVKMAQTSPSACNRQAVRVYCIDSKKFLEDINNNLEGIGGFAEEVDKFLLICGKMSAYEEKEYKQFIVSASMFAGYLSLALHSLGIGGCVVQRPLRTTKEWVDFREKNNIPADEHMVCMIAIGNLKEETKVPVSHRYPVEKILKVLD